MTSLQESTFEITHQGRSFSGFVTSPDCNSPLPAVIMFPGATGATPTFCRTAQELANAGYLAIGVDMYGTGADISTPKAAGVHFEALLNYPDLLRARVIAWFEAVCAREDVDATRVSAIGYCFGGKCVLELARGGTPVRSVSSFHGLLTTHSPAQPNTFQGYAAIWTGGRDPHAPLSDLESLKAEFTAAGIDYQATVFANAQHSFTDPDNDGIAPGIAYNYLADRTSWAATLALLEHVLH